MKKHESELRAKVDTAVTAALRMHFARILESTGFVNSAIVAMSLQSPSDLRVIRQLRQTGSVPSNAPRHEITTVGQVAVERIGAGSTHGVPRMLLGFGRSTHLGVHSTGTKDPRPRCYKRSRSYTIYRNWPEFLDKTFCSIFGYKKKKKMKKTPKMKKIKKKNKVFDAAVRCRYGWCVGQESYCHPVQPLAS